MLGTKLLEEFGIQIPDHLKVLNDTFTRFYINTKSGVSIG